VRLGAVGEEVLESIYQHRLLSTRQIHDLHNGSSTYRATQQVLRRLRGDKLAARVRVPGGLAIWFLTRLGTEEVEQTAGRVEKRRKLILPEQAAGPLQAHTLAVNDVGIAFAQMAQRRGDEFGPFAWRHEIAHPLEPRRQRRAQERLITDAVLSYQAINGSATSFHYRFLELDRANRPADDLAAKLSRYGRLYRLPATAAGTNVPTWKDRYRVFPNVLVVLAGRSRAALERRRRTLLLLAEQDADLAKAKEIDIAACLLADLTERGPDAAIFARPSDPDRRTNWLGEER
jgi:hypothetical protein